MLDKADTIFKDKVDVAQDFVQGDKNTIEKLIINIYGNQASPDFTDKDLQEQLAEYRRYIVETYKYLDFKGIDGIAEAVKGSGGVTLEAVYVPLRARMDTPEGESWHRLGGRYYCGSKAVTDNDPDKLEQEIMRADASALPVEQWINDQQALVILGDPGSGKSTSMKRLALGLAQCNNAPLPVLLPLNAYSKSLEQDPISFEKFLPEYFQSKRTQLEKGKLQRLFTKALQQQKAVILMDGLDEVGNNRGEVVSQVESFMRAWIPDPQDKQKSGNRMVVSSRFVGYRDYPLADPRWKTVALNDWNSEEVGRFFRAFTFAVELAWVGGENHENTQSLAETELQSLLQVVEHNQGIRHLSGNPLLASLLALIKRQGVTLPHRRVELYNLYMGTLLRSWNRSRSLDKQPIGLEIDFSPTQRLLAKLALHLRQTNPQGGLIHEEAMRDYLLNYYQNDGYTRKEAGEQSKGFLDSVHKYSNLLIEKGYQQYGFIHLTFEEYLAGFGLALERENILYEKIPRLLQQPEHWKETLLLSLGVMSVVNTDTEKTNGILEELMSGSEPAHVLFAGAVLNDVGTSVLGNRMTRKIQNELLNLMRNSESDIDKRVEAGRILSDVGDLRSGVILKKVNGLTVYRQRGDRQHAIPDIEWQEIPAGTFRMGSIEGDEGYKGEWPAHDLTLSSFFISRNPVTNAQYRCFIEAGMYQDKEFWHEKMPEAANSWLQGSDPEEKLFATLKDENFRVSYHAWLRGDKNRLSPRFWNEKYWTLDNHPVIGVSWFEALAYSLWLNELLAEIKPVNTPDDFGIRLPTEAEWEYAARGADSWRYSWGNEPDPQQGNYLETGINRTSAVGLFPISNAFGLNDMTGNVREWTLSRWGKSSRNPPDFTYDQWSQQESERNLLEPVEFRITRGGGYDCETDYVRCAFRNWLHPNDRFFNLGFRVVLGKNILATTL